MLQGSESDKNNVCVENDHESKNISRFEAVV